MRKFITGLCVAGSLGCGAQNFCHTSEVMQAWFAKHPELLPLFEKHRQNTAAKNKAFYLQQQNKSGHETEASQVPSYTIPVVFHILHQGGLENISDAQVIDQVNILNRDFNKMNADTVDVVAPFKNHIGNAGIVFMLAKRDPNGNCTNGIIRHWVKNTYWNGDSSDYVHTWPADKYLNIYVVKTMEPGVAGYTYLPGWTWPQMDAIVILNNFVGSIGTSGVFTSRVLTHEVGHWLDLEHPWGWNPPGVSCGDDGVWDTPYTMGFSGCSLGNAAICFPPTVENVQNYMDYSYCNRMFTHGQVFRMLNALNNTLGGRDNLSTPQNLSFTGITNPAGNCIPLMDLAAFPAATLCSGGILSLKSYTSNAAAGGFTWTATNGAQVTSPNSPTTSILFTNIGTSFVNCTAAGSGGSVTKGLTVVVVDGNTMIKSAYAESFESTPLPAHWSIPQGGPPSQTWQTNTLSAAHGTRSAFVPGINPWPGSYQVLQTPSYDFKNHPGAQFTFKYAYARKSSLSTDKFKVQASKDCGGIWTDIYVPGMHVLAQSSGGIKPGNFVPTQAQWVFYDLTYHPAFTPFKSEPNVQLRFWYKEDSTGLSNRIYLDEINFVSTVGIRENLLNIPLTVFPNPSTGETHLQFSLGSSATVNWRLLNLTGSLLRASGELPLQGGDHQLSIDLSELARGIYFVTLQVDGAQVTRKLVIE